MTIDAAGYLNLSDEFMEENDWKIDDPIIFVHDKDEIVINNPAADYRRMVRETLRETLS